MGPAKDEQNLEVAMKENEVILLEDDFSTKYEGFDPKSPESYIMFTVMQNTFKEQSTLLASLIQNQFRDRINRVDRGVQQAGFWVLYMTTMPSVLVESGYITNPDEEKYLCSNEGQDYIASAIYRAVKQYLSEIDKKSNISTATEPPAVQMNDTSAIIAEPLDSGLAFMVQIVSSSDRKQLNPGNFKGLDNVVELFSSGRYRYASGNFIKYSDAVEYRRKLEQIYPDAFVIAVENNKILPLHDALEKTKKK
jgi:N-acetylmuramoyl-L-alanine amidase